MKKKIEKLLATSLASLGYAAPIGLGIWHVLRGRGAVGRRPRPEVQSVPEVTPQAPSPSPKPKLESLSLSTPGEAPLDRIARTAVWEESVEDQPERCNLKTPEPPGSDAPRPPEDGSVAGLLNYQSLASYRLEGWSVPEPKRLPVPTYAPAIMAFGIVIFAMGLATIWYVCVMGAVVFGVAAWRWVGELQGE